MNLLLDLGNSSLKWALHDGARRVSGGRVGHDRLRVEPFPEWRAAAHRLDRIVAVSVAPEPVWHTVEARLGELLGRSARRLLTPPSGMGVRSRYPEPARMGADRWAAMVGAMSGGPLPAIVVDCGTAITVDWLDADGTHRGGLILAGITAQYEALGRRAPVLADRARVDTLSLFATDTEAAVHGGVLQGVAAMIDGVVQRMEHDRGLAARRWLAGGDAFTLAPLLMEDYTCRPDLVLDGLSIIATGPQGGRGKR